jgi:putative ABC transport system permease protein
LKVYLSDGIDVVVYREAGVYRSSMVLDESLADEIAKIPGVRDASPSLNDVIGLVDLGVYTVILQGNRLDSFLLDEPKIVAGRRIRPDDRHALMLGKRIAADLGKSAGDTLRLPNEIDYSVVGVFESRHLLKNGIIFLPLDELQQLTGREGSVTGIVVRTDSGDRRFHERLSEQIKAMEPGLGVQPTKEFIESAVEIRLANALAWMTSAVALVVGCIGMINTMIISYHERIHEIALLRAIGWRRRRVMGLILLESLLLGLSGGVLGMLFGVGLVELLRRLPAAAQVMSGGIALSAFAQAFVLATVVSLVGGGCAGIRALQMQPVEGLRQQ